MTDPAAATTTAATTHPATTATTAPGLIVVGANLTTDRTLELSQLVPGNVMRPRRATVTPGGKSVNVCRAAQAFGHRPRLVANLPGRGGETVAHLLAAEGHDVARVVTAGDVRTATIIIEDDRRITVLNEPGPELSATDRHAFLTAFRHETTTTATTPSPTTTTAATPSATIPRRVVAMSGSLPPGAAASDLYARLTEIAHEAGFFVVLDAARADLAAALPSRPDVVTPNLSEALAVLTGEPVDESVETDAPDLRATASDAARRLRSLGAGAALVTVGRHGVAGADGDGEFWIDGPRVELVSSIGAGDAFVGGLSTALYEGLPLREAALRAVASGSASVATSLAGQPDPTVLAHLLTPGTLTATETPQATETTQTTESPQATETTHTPAMTS